MKWIDVNEDLPPPHTRILVSVHVLGTELIEGFEVIRDAYFDPSRGWIYWGFNDQISKVSHWCDLPVVPPKQPISEESQVDVLKQDDSQENRLASDPEDSS